MADIEGHYVLIKELTNITIVTIYMHPKNKHEKITNILTLSSMLLKDHCIHLNENNFFLQRNYKCNG